MHYVILMSSLLYTMLTKQLCQHFKLFRVHNTILPNLL